jgi:hypothetical protein
VVTDAAPKRRQGFWLTVGEIVAVLALAVAALNYWESHKEHVDEVRQISAEKRAQAAFVVTGTAVSDGRRIALKSLKSSQAIQSQRYYFPKSILDHAMEVAAAEPQIDLGWIEEGLRKAPRSGKSGESTLPVAIVTTFVEDGDTRTDTSLYRIGYGWTTGLFGGPKFRLQGIALSRRAVKGDPAGLVER